MEVLCAHRIDDDGNPVTFRQVIILPPVIERESVLKSTATIALGKDPDRLAGVGRFLVEQLLGSPGGWLRQEYHEVGLRGLVHGHVDGGRLVRSHPGVKSPQPRSVLT